MADPLCFRQRRLRLARFESSNQACEADLPRAIWPVAACRPEDRLLHSDDAKLFQSTIQSGRYDLVCYGHTHVAKREQIGKTLVLNPGALYRANPHSIAIVDLKTLDVNFVSL